MFFYQRTQLHIDCRIVKLRNEWGKIETYEFHRVIYLVAPDEMGPPKPYLTVVRQ